MPPAGHEPFLAAICADPDDDGVRLVYADWLEENGDPARAELIRLEVRLAAGGLPPDVETPLRQREKQLIDENRTRWLAELPEVSGVSWDFDPWTLDWNTCWRFDRGFVGGASFNSVGAFRKYAARVFRATPLRAVCLRRVRPDDVGVFAQGRFRTVRQLEVFGDELRAEDVAHIVTAAPLQGLTFLKLVGELVGDDVVARVCEPGVLPRLTYFWACSAAGDRSVELLAASHLAARLEQLHLFFSTRVGDRGAEVVASGAFPRLRRLGLATQVGDRGAMALARSPVLGQLEWLWLDHNRIGVEGAAALCHGPRSSRMEHLYLRYNPVPDDVAAALERECGPSRVSVTPTDHRPAPA